MPALATMVDDLAKHCLRNELRDLRAVMVMTLDGLSEYDVRRPLTPTGTNLLGMVKHLATWESLYLGEVFGRPYPERLYTPERPGTDLWVTADETRHGIIDRYRQVAAHADATIGAIDLGARGHVPWWPRPDVTLLNILIHLISETARHAGHADILRQQLDGSTNIPSHDTADWAGRNAIIERAARDARTLIE